MALNLLPFRPSAAGSNPAPGFGARQAPVLRPRFGSDGDELALLKREVAELRQASGDYSTLMARTVPATVSIRLAVTPVIDPAVLTRLEKELQRGPGLFGSPRPLPPDLKAAIEDLKNPKEQPLGAGSGFWIRCADGKPRILTAAHVVDGLANKGGKPFMIQAVLPLGPDGEPGAIPLPATGDQKATGLLNFLRTALHAENRHKAQSVALKLATIPGTFKPAFSPAEGGYDLALLEPADDGFYVKKDGRFELPGGIAPLELEEQIDKNHPGQRVLKIGNSAGDEGNVSDGVISGFKVKEKCQCGNPKHNDDPEYLVVENNAMLNPGDSGGALVNMAGKVIGMNQYITAHAGEGIAVQGVGFSLAASEMRKLLGKWGFLA